MYSVAKASFPSSFNKSRLNYCICNQRLYKYLVDTPLFGSKYPCMYQFLCRNTQKSYFGDNMTMSREGVFRRLIEACRRVYWCTAELTICFWLKKFPGTSLNSQYSLTNVHWFINIFTSSAVLKIAHLFCNSKVLPVHALCLMCCLLYALCRLWMDIQADPTLNVLSTWVLLVLPLVNSIQFEFVLLHNFLDESLTTFFQVIRLVLLLYSWITNGRIQ